jgi:hypothetical protein
MVREPRRDYALAFGWLQTAVDSGSARARTYLAELDDNVTVDQRARVTDHVRDLLRKGAVRPADIVGRRSGANAPAAVVVTNIRIKNNAGIGTCVES